MVTKFQEVVDLAAESQGDAQLLTASLQDVQQTLARNAGNNMASAADCLPAIMHIDGIPDHEMIGYLLICLIVSPLERGERAIRKDHTPAIGHIGRIALDDSDVIRGMRLFDEQPAIETSRPSAEDDDLHSALP